MHGLGWGGYTLGHGPSLDWSISCSGLGMSRGIGLPSVLPRPRLDVGWFGISARPAGLEHLKEKKQQHTCNMQQEILEQNMKLPNSQNDCCYDLFHILMDNQAAAFKPFWHELDPNVRKEKKPTVGRMLELPVIPC